MTSGLDPDTFLQRAITYERSNPITWTAVDVQVTTIRGEQSSITKYIGTARDGAQYQAWTGQFTGKGGPAMLAIVGAAGSWDETLAADFIASLR